MSRWGSQRGDRLAYALLAVAATVLAFWVSAALLMSSHGFDLSDEGYYVLSYRWWDSTPRTVTGVQYLYGPLFEVLGYDVRALRVLRLVTVVSAHAVFAWGFVTWLQTVDKASGLSIARCWAFGILIVASGGITYGRLPLSPGYNDVSLLASLVLVAAVLRILVGARRNAGVLPVGPALAMPPLVIMMLLAKWSAAVVVVAFVAILALAALRTFVDHVRAGRFLAAGAASLVVSVVLVDVVMGGFSSAIPPMLRVNKLVAAQTNSPVSLIRMYSETGLELSLLVASLCFVPLVVIGLSWLLRRMGLARWANAALLVAPVVAVGMSYLYLHGSGVREEVLRYTTSLVGLSALAVGAVIVASVRAPDARPRSARDERYVVILLAGLPVMQALGTGNAVFALAVNQFAAWAALFVLATLTVAPGPTRQFLNVAAVCAMAVAGLGGGVGLVTHPYRTEALDGATSVIGGPGPTARLRVAPSEARRLEAVRVALAGVRTRDRPMMAFDELPGLIASLDGRSVGETWYSASDRKRSAANITDACQHGNPWGDRQPIIFYNRRPREEDLGAFRTCGIDLFQDYRAVQVSGFKPALTVYIPNRSDQ